MLYKGVARKLLLFLRKKKIQNDHIDPIEIPLNLVEKYLPSRPVIIDCGAHVGIDSVKLSHIPGSEIYSFEPLETLFKKLLENTAGHPNISCFKFALSNYNGSADFYVSSGDSDASSSLLKPKDHITDHPSVKFNEVTKVNCQTLDSWAEKNAIEKVDMLWLDMQGFEQTMLEASKKILPRVSVIHSEVSIRETYEGVRDYKDYRNFLQNMGFKVVAEAIPEGYDMGNVLFVRA